LTRSFQSNNMSQAVLSSQLAVENKLVNSTSQPLSGAGYCLNFDNAAAVSTPLTISDFKEVSLEFLVKGCSHGGVIMSIATENITFALSDGDTRAFTKLYPNPDGTPSVFMQSLFRPLIGSTISLSHLDSLEWRSASYSLDGDGNKMTLLTLASPVDFRTLTINATTGSWSSSTLHVHFGRFAYDTGITLQLNQWNQITLVWISKEVQLFVFNANGTSSSKTMALGDSVLVNRARIGLGTWLTSLDAGVPPGVAYCGQLDELRLWNRRSNLFIVQQGLNLNIAAGTPGLVGLWKFNEGSGIIAYDDLTRTAFIFAELTPPVWSVSDDYAIPLEHAFSVSYLALPKTSSVTPIMMLYRRALSENFGTVWPTSINPMGLSVEQQANTVLKCSTWMSGAVMILCENLYPTPAQFYWFSCLRETALNGNLTFGLRAVFSFATYCQSIIPTPIWPAQSLCNEGSLTTWIGPDCDISCYFGVAALNSNGSTYCKCDAIHYGPDCSAICPGVEEGLLCGGHGECNSIDGTCLCHPRWMGDALCSSCSTGWVGSDCSVAISSLPNSTATPGVCVSFGDPHISTFSGTNYNMNTPGTFVLMRSPQTMVQALQVPCVGTRTCIRNDEVTIQANSITVIVYAPVDGTNYPLMVTNVVMAF